MDEIYKHGLCVCAIWDILIGELLRFSVLMCVEITDAPKL